MVLLTEVRREAAKENSVRCLILGLDNAGKSTVVAKFFGEDIADVAPTVGFSIKTKLLRGITVDFWDVGGQRTLRPFWSNYFHGTDALIWVVDSGDSERLNDCKRELHDVLREERLEGAGLLVLCNKQDITDAVSVETISKILAVESLRLSRWVEVQACSALTDTPEAIRRLFLDIIEKQRERKFDHLPSLGDSAWTDKEDVASSVSAITPEQMKDEFAAAWNSNPIEAGAWGFRAELRGKIFDENPEAVLLRDDFEESREIAAEVITEIARAALACSH